MQAAATPPQPESTQPEGTQPEGTQPEGTQPEGTQPSVHDLMTAARRAQGQAMANGVLWVGRTIAAAARAVVYWNRRRAIRAQLLSMDDHILVDIGIDPHQLDTVAAELAANENDARFAA